MLAPRRLVCVLLLAAACPAAVPATAAEESARSVATYVVVEAARDRDAARALLAYAAGTRRDAGARRVLVLSELDRPGKFVLLESWRDEAAWNAHAGGPVRQSLLEALQPHLLAPFDERVGLPTQAEGDLAEPRGALHVVLHVDVLQPGVDAIGGMLREAARAAALVPGAIAFEVAAQAAKRNHLTVHQVWASRAAYAAYTASAGAKEFRARFNPVKGAVYDDRLFTLVGP